jgi:hypothetical protein
MFGLRKGWLLVGVLILALLADLASRFIEVGLRQRKEVYVSSRNWVSEDVIKQAKGGVYT